TVAALLPAVAVTFPGTLGTAQEVDASLGIAGCVVDVPNGLGGTRNTFSPGCLGYVRLSFGPTTGPCSAGGGAERAAADVVPDAIAAPLLLAVATSVISKQAHGRCSRKCRNIATPPRITRYTKHE